MSFFKKKREKDQVQSISDAKIKREFDKRCRKEQTTERLKKIPFRSIQIQVNIFYSTNRNEYFVNFL